MNVTVNNSYPLSPWVTPQKSFYNKAIVSRETIQGIEFHILTSYNTPVAVYDFTHGVMYLTSKWDYSNTTLKHVKEFMYQKQGVTVTKGDIQCFLDQGGLKRLKSIDDCPYL